MAPLRVYSWRETQASLCRLRQVWYYVLHRCAVEMYANPRIAYRKCSLTGNISRWCINSSAVLKAHQKDLYVLTWNVSDTMMICYMAHSSHCLIYKRLSFTATEPCLLFWLFDELTKCIAIGQEIHSQFLQLAYILIAFHQYDDSLSPWVTEG